MKKRKKMKDPLAFKTYFLLQTQKKFESTAHFECQAKSDLL